MTGNFFSFTRFTLTLLATTLLTNNVSADTSNDRGFYIGGALSSIDITLGQIDSSAVGVIFVSGYDFTEWFGLDGQLLVTTGLDINDEENAFASMSIAPKFSLPLNSHTKLFARAGLASAAFSDEYSDYSGIGITYGIGAEFKLNEGVFARLSYDQLNADMEDVDDDFFSPDIDVDMSQIVASVYYRF